MGIPQQIRDRKAVRLSRIYKDFCNLCQRPIRDSYTHFRDKHPMEFIAIWLGIKITKDR